MPETHDYLVRVSSSGICYTELATRGDYKVPTLYVLSHKDASVVEED